MKRLVLPIIAAYMLLTGTVCCLDLILVLAGYVTPVSYPNLGMSWNDSLIFHYNVSPAANVLMGMFGAMALFVGLFLVVVNRTPKSKVHTWQKPKATKQVDKWLQDQLN